MNLLVNQTIKWFTDKNMQELDPFNQYMKLVEEYGELTKAIIRNDVSEVIDAIGDMLVVMIGIDTMKGHRYSFYDYDFDKVGSLDHTLNEAWGLLDNLMRYDTFAICSSNQKYTMLVVLNDIAYHYGKSLHECLEVAYNVIKDREGFVYHNVFYKRLDLEKMGLWDELVNNK